MQAEDNTFKVIDPLFGRRICDAPGGRLETINSAGRRVACQFTAELGIGFSSGYVDSRSNQQGRSRGNIGQRVKLGPTAQSEGGSAQQEEGDVASQGGGQLHEFLYRQ